MQKLCRHLIPVMAVLVLVLSAKAHASNQYLDNDPNYPLSYAHAHYLEYVDLISSTYNDESCEYDTYATGYVAYSMEKDFNTSSYQTRLFRQIKNRSQNPQVFENGQWVSLPAYNSPEIQAYIKAYGYAEYVEHYHPFAYYMFKIIYKQVRGTDYPDGLNGDTF